MKWYQDYNFIFAQFEKGDERVDETTFYFRSDPEEVEHYIGYLSQYEKRNTEFGTEASGGDGRSKINPP